ncbi:UL51 [Gallid alphaherpesvirus 2]|nr:UL51 [Gallid alphaherpesvirus 2]
MQTSSRTYDYRRLKAEYKQLSASSSTDKAMHRLREAVHAVNILLPTPITLEMALLSADGVRKLVRGQSLARTYSACLRNLECLSKHVPGRGNPGLDAVVETHRENAQRVADTCAAALLHMYMSIGTGRTDAFVEHAIQLTAATETAMSDIALVERALGLTHPHNERSPASMDESTGMKNCAVLSHMNDNKDDAVNMEPGDNTTIDRLISSPLLSQSKRERTIISTPAVTPKDNCPPVKFSRENNLITEL